MNTFTVVLNISKILSTGINNAIPSAGNPNVPAITTADNKLALAEIFGMIRAVSVPLGIAAGLTGQTIANIEVHGMIPRVDTAEMLAKALGMSPSWLAFGVGKPLVAETPATDLATD